MAGARLDNPEDGRDPCQQEEPILDSAERDKGNGEKGQVPSCHRTGRHKKARQEMEGRVPYHRQGDRSPRIHRIFRLGDKTCRHPQQVRDNG